MLTVDQRDSRSQPDAVPDLLARLADAARRCCGPSSAPVGDEVQAVLADADSTVATSPAAARRRLVGRGRGRPVEQPLPADTRAGRGEAYLHARDAVTRRQVRAAPASLSWRGLPC